MRRPVRGATCININKQKTDTEATEWQHAAYCMVQCERIFGPRPVAGPAREERARKPVNTAPPQQAPTPGTPTEGDQRRLALGPKHGPWPVAWPSARSMALGPTRSAKRTRGKMQRHAARYRHVPVPNSPSASAHAGGTGRNRSQGQGQKSPKRGNGHQKMSENAVTDDKKSEMGFGAAWRQTPAKETIKRARGKRMLKRARNSEQKWQNAR